MDEHKICLTSLLTWVHLLICCHAVSVHNVLKPSSKFVQFEVGGWRVLGGHSVENGRNSGSTALLSERERREKGEREREREREGEREGEGERERERRES